MRVSLICLLVVQAAAVAYSGEPLRLHPDNPHYFLFRGKPAVLVTSTEHYGAVLNLHFDFIPYLDELQSHGLNLTRTFSGVYCEVPGNFNIKGNTLAPATGRLIAPWARSDQPGYAGGGNKFDLSRWDEAYFERLKQFVGEAGKRGIVVELVLFCPFYEESMWSRSPLNAANNVNRIGHLARTDVYALKDDAVTDVQMALVRKLAGELQGFDNLYYEICNEPYFGGVTLDWQARIAATLSKAEDDFPQRHLIAQNIANGSTKIADANPQVSIFNFHYATPPDAVAANFHLHKPIGDDETGFRGSDDLTYRGEGWEFLLAGGSVYDNLDYSFTVGHEAGTATPDAPGGGGRDLRRQLGVLKRFIESFDFVRMIPNASIVSGLPEGGRAQVLAHRGKEYAIYVRGGSSARLGIKLPRGKYRAQWLHPGSGKMADQSDLEATAETTFVQSPTYEQDLALAIRSRE
ncbi:MAG TPA: putative collagen-binding domain-containing protein [Pirellulales bacterium]|nr:putative collagen-binding domain-containing protein [Pirellulales bacterium]